MLYEDTRNLLPGPWGIDTFCMIARPRSTDGSNWKVVLAGWTSCGQSTRWPLAGVGFAPPRRPAWSAEMSDIFFRDFFGHYVAASAVLRPLFCGMGWRQALRL